MTTLLNLAMGLIKGAITVSAAAAAADGSKVIQDLLKESCQQCIANIMLCIDFRQGKRKKEASW